MKRIIIIAALLALSAGTARAEVTASQLQNAGIPAAAADIISGIGTGGTVQANNSYLKFRDAADANNVNWAKLNTGDDLVLNSSASDDLVLQLEDDANRLIFFDAASDAALRMAFGDGGTTATQILLVSASTSDADDDSTARLCGGGAYAADGSRGACISVPGEEVAGGGDIAYVAGASDTHVFSAGSTETMSIGATGLVTAAAGFTATTGDVTITAGDLQLTATGKTIEYETGTAASACMGVGTLNGTTAVTISTTCATTGSKIFISRTSDGSGSAANDQVGAWATNIVNGTSFDIDSGDANDSATINWVIFHEAP